MVSVSSTRTSATSDAWEDLRRRALERARHAADTATAPPVDAGASVDEGASVAPLNAFRASFAEVGTQPQVHPVEAPETPVEVRVVDGRFEVAEDVSAEALAAELYGDASLAPLVARDGRAIDVVPELLTPRHARAFASALDATLDADLERLVDARATGDGDELGAALVDALERWSTQPRGAETRARVVKLLAAAKALSGEPPSFDALARAAGAHEGGVRARLANALAATGADAELKGLLERGASFVLDRLEGLTTAAESRAIADYLAHLAPNLQAGTLLALMQRYDDRDALGLYKYGEAVPENMLYYLFEDLRPEERARVADSFRRGGILPEAAIEALMAGRGPGGKYLPASTEWAKQATEYWAEASSSEDSITRGAASFAGGLSSLWLPETSVSTALTLASGGVTSLLFGHSLLLDVALTAGGLAWTGKHAIDELRTLLTSRDVRTGKELSPEEKLATILSLGSGMILLGTGAALALGAGGPARVQLRPGDVARLNRDCVRIPVEGLPPGTEVWVPRHHPRRPRSRGPQLERPHDHHRAGSADPGRRTPRADSRTAASHGAPGARSARVRRGRATDREVRRRCAHAGADEGARVHAGRSRERQGPRARRRRARRRRRVRDGEAPRPDGQTSPSGGGPGGEGSGGRGRRTRDAAARDRPRRGRPPRRHRVRARRQGEGTLRRVHGGHSRRRRSAAVDDARRHDRQ